MGTINFKTSEYITMGVKPYDVESILNDKDFMDYVREDYPGEDPEEIANETIISYYEADRANIESILNKYDFTFYNVDILPGYYESIQIYIDNNLPLYFDDDDEKREALEEVDKMTEFLKEAAGVGFVACFPSWATGYTDHAETLKEIDEAAGKMREEIASAATWESRQKEA